MSSWTQDRCADVNAMYRDADYKLFATHATYIQWLTVRRLKGE